jgi:hypothetical protein
MMKPRTLLAGLALGAAVPPACLGGATEPEVLYAVQGGVLYAIERADGAITLGPIDGPYPPGGLGYCVNALATRPGNQIITAGGCGVGGNDLVLVDPVARTGTILLEMTMPQDYPGVVGLAFNSAGSAYVVLGGDSGEDDVLARVNLVTGQVQIVGTMGMTAVQSLAFDASDVLYAADNGAGLATVNVNTGVATAVSGLDLEADVQGLEFTSDGLLLGVRFELLHIDPATGNSTAVGFTGHDLRGLGRIAEPTAGACCFDGYTCVVVALADCLALGLEVLGAGSTCQVDPCCPDANGDDVTDVADLVAVVKDWGCAGPECADVDYNDMVDVSDLVDLVTHWGCGGGR